MAQTAEAGASLHTAALYRRLSFSVGGLWRRYFAVPDPPAFRVDELTRFELVLNFKAAKIIDHRVPAGPVARADEVIE